MHPKSSIAHLHALLDVLRKLRTHATDDRRNGLKLCGINRCFLRDLRAGDPSREFESGSLIIGVLMPCCVQRWKCQRLSSSGCLFPLLNGDRRHSIARLTVRLIYVASIFGRVLIGAVEILDPRAMVSNH
jgi:hypothetical protein